MIRPRLRRRYRPLDTLVRCSACGTYNDPELVATGDEAIPTYDPVTFEDLAGQSLEACRFCGCPRWLNGGKLGDMNR